MTPKQVSSFQILEDAFDDRFWLPVENDDAQVEYDVQNMPLRKLVSGGFQLE